MEGGKRYAVTYDGEKRFSEGAAPVTKAISPSRVSCSRSATPSLFFLHSRSHCKPPPKTFPPLSFLALSTSSPLIPC